MANNLFTREGELYRPDERTPAERSGFALRDIEALVRGRGGWLERMRWNSLTKLLQANNNALQEVVAIENTIINLLETHFRASA